MSIGLVGDGSDCFGFDDEYSRDHDWGPGFCIWLDKDDFDLLGAGLQRVYESLPADFNGFRARITSVWGEGRVGVLETGRFYQRFLGAPVAPDSPAAWFRIPENALAAACNGKVFYGPFGSFASIRNTLLEYYPEDVRLKKLAARCMTAGREGQYNYSRSLRRNEFYAAAQAEMKFLEDALSMVFLLNKRFRPYYKWAHRAVRELPVLGAYSYELISVLMETGSRNKKSKMIEGFAQSLIDRLREDGLSQSGSDFLPDHGPEIQQRIKNRTIRGYDVWAG